MVVREGAALQNQPNDDEARSATPPTPAVSQKFKELFDFDRSSSHTNMASKSAGSITFEIDKVIQPIYTGGDVSISANGLVLATCVEEEALLTNPETGEALCRIEGV